MSQLGYAIRTTIALFVCVSNEICLGKNTAHWLM